MLRQDCFHTDHAAVIQLGPINRLPVFFSDQNTGHEIQTADLGASAVGALQTGNVMYGVRAFRTDGWYRVEETSLPM